MWKHDGGGGEEGRAGGVMDRKVFVRESHFCFVCGGCKSLKRLVFPLVGGSVRLFETRIFCRGSSTIALLTSLFFCANASAIALFFCDFCWIFCFARIEVLAFHRFLPEFRLSDYLEPPENCNIVSRGKYWELV